MAGSWWVYIALCADGSVYTGITTDLRRRIAEHNSDRAGAKYTRSRRPVSLVYFESAANRSTAARREYRIKRLSVSAKVSLIVSAFRQAPERAVEHGVCAQSVARLGNHFPLGEEVV